MISYAVNATVFIGMQLLMAYIRNGWPLLGLEHGLLRSFAVPVGAGMIAIRSIGYVADIYHQRMEAEEDFINLSLYTCFFPGIVAGPMANYEEFRENLTGRTFDRDLFFDGICKFVTGFAKKILLAGNLAVIADEVFRLSTKSDSLAHVPVSLAWLGLIAFILQVYYDFSSYSDMSIGLAGIFGFHFKENFRSPYLVNSMTSFWDRWNITIKGWFDKYVSHPLDQRLAANRDQMVATSFLVFVLFGLWHKASIGIVIWAFLQVLFITVERVITYDKRKIPGIIRHLYVFLAVAISWAVFRAGNLYHVLLFLRNLFGMNQNGFTSAMTMTYLQEYWIFLLAGLFFLFPVGKKIAQKMDASGSRVASGAAAVIYPILMMAVFVLSVVYLARGFYVPEAYFNF